MNEITCFYDEIRTIRKVLVELKRELQQLATGERIEKEIVEMARGFIVFNVFEEHFIKTEERLGNDDYKAFRQMTTTIKRLQGLSQMYFEYFSHYWECFNQANDLAKYDVISYGESCITAIQESMKLEEKLFNLTTRDCIVK